LAAKAKGLGRKLLQEEATIVTPETLLAWHRKLAAEKYHGAASGGPAKPTTSTHLWVNMAEENRDWGYWRIQGALSNTTVLQIKHSGVELFCGYAIRARPTGETLCGIHGWPGESRRAR